MDEFLKFYSNTNPSLPGNLEFISSFAFVLISSLILCYGYKKTHSGYSFSSSYLVSLILISLIVCLIMVIIGSNIARAFALIGAMSIVRFRNPVKETRDLVYIFASIAIGMSAGTGFYSTTILFAFLFSSVAIIFNNFSFFEKDDLINIISIDLKINQLNDFEKILIQNTSKYKLISHSSLEKNQNINQYVYEIELINQNSLSKIYEETNKRGYINFKSIFGSSIINA